MLFTDFPLKQWLQKSLQANGYTETTPIQEKVLNLALRGANVVWQSQTGTGKTAAFLLPILNNIDSNKKTVQALILAPTRELVTQIGDEIRDLTKFYSITHTCLYGGASVFLQKKSLLKKPAIIVATPGRLQDFMNQKIVDLSSAQYFVLDEVDRMLDMWFVRDIEKIWAKLTAVQQTYTFSATMEDKIKRIIEKHIRKYEFIKIGDAVTVDKIDHSYLPVKHEDKLHNVIQLIKWHPKDKIIIFTHSKRNTETIQKILVSAKISATFLNGDLRQGKRQNTLNDFKVGKIKVLVTTDVAARGLNMENVGLVINFEVPADIQSYIHRIGRTGRAGASGKAIMLVSPAEKRLLQDIEKFHKTKVVISWHTSLEDSDQKYNNVHLNKSTDKMSGKRMAVSENHRSPKTQSRPSFWRNDRRSDRSADKVSFDNYEHRADKPFEKKPFDGDARKPKRFDESKAQRPAHSKNPRKTEHTENRMQRSARADFEYRQGKTQKGQGRYKKSK